MKKIYIAGGCFWGVQKFFDMIDGVLYTKVGYANGTTENPTYEQVCTKTTGHAETVYVEYDENKISLEKLLELYYKTIDPTSLNKQGADVGNQYRTGIYFVDDEDMKIINMSLAKLQESYVKEVVVECEPLVCFYDAEEYHQKYLEKNPNGYCHLTSSQYDYARNYKPLL